MHYPLEVIMPPTDNIEASLEQILGAYSENYEDEDGGSNSNAFYDYYVIGGRWSGHKLKAMLGKKKMKELYDRLVKEKITVSGFVAGKESLKPSSQIEKVNKLWNEHFPESPIKECPLFDNYKEDFGDVMKLSEIPDSLTTSRIIIAKHHWENKGEFEAEFMFSTQIWNGCNYQDTSWDGEVKTALKEYKKKMKNVGEEFKKKNMPMNNWLCVTIDYHS